MTELQKLVQRMAGCFLCSVRDHFGELYGRNTDSVMLDVSSGSPVLRVRHLVDSSERPGEQDASVEVRELTEPEVVAVTAWLTANAPKKEFTRQQVYNACPADLQDRIRQYAPKIAENLYVSPEPIPEERVRAFLAVNVAYGLLTETESSRIMASLMEV